MTEEFSEVEKLRMFAGQAGLNSAIVMVREIVNVQRLAILGNGTKHSESELVLATSTVLNGKDNSFKLSVNVELSVIEPLCRLIPMLCKAKMLPDVLCKEYSTTSVVRAFVTVRSARVNGGAESEVGSVSCSTTSWWSTDGLMRAIGTYNCKQMTI